MPTVLGTFVFFTLRGCSYIGESHHDEPTGNTLRQARRVQMTVVTLVVTELRSSWLEIRMVASKMRIQSKLKKIKKKHCLGGVGRRHEPASPGTPGRDK